MCKNNTNKNPESHKYDAGQLIERRNMNNNNSFWFKAIVRGKETAKKNETKEVLVVHRYGINKKNSIEQHEISDEKSK